MDERSQNFLYGHKSRFDRKQLRTASPRPSGSHETLLDSRVSGTHSRMHKSHLNEVENRLKSLAKFPHFLAPPPRGRKPEPIDAVSIIQNLREMTSYVDSRRSGWDDPEEFFAGGSGGKLFIAIVDLHVLSFSGKAERTPTKDSPTTPNFMSSWTGICTAMGLYLHSVLGTWNAGRPMSGRMLCRIIQVLKRHLIRDRQRLGGKGGLDRDFWFWRTFVGAMALARQRYAVKPASPIHSSLILSSGSRSATIASTSSFEINGGINHLEVLEEWFLHSIKKWSRTASIKTWGEARAVLAKVVWPENLSSEPLAMSLWHRAMQVSVV